MATKLGKRLRNAVQVFDPEELHQPARAMGIVKDNAKAKFDETIEIALKLGVDPRKADQMVRGTVSLPAGTGKSVRVAVFASGDKAREARDARAGGGGGGGPIGGGSRG